MSFPPVGPKISFDGDDIQRLATTPKDCLPMPAATMTTTNDQMEDKVHSYTETGEISLEVSTTLRKIYLYKLEAYHYHLNFIPRARKSLVSPKDLDLNCSATILSSSTVLNAQAAPL